MNGLIHPFTKALYEQDGSGHVKVTSGSRTGLFRSTGEHISGELEEADPQLCGWVAGPVFGNHRLATAPKS